MTKTSINLDAELDQALKIRLAKETAKAKTKDKTAKTVTAQKFITDLLKKELGIKK